MKKPPNLTVYRVLLLAICWGAFLVPNAFAATQVSAQTDQSNQFDLRATSSNTYFATSTDFIATQYAGGSFSDIVFIASPAGSASSTQASVICNGSTVTSWFFDLSLLSSTTLYNLRGSVDGVVTQSTAIPATGTCYIQWIMEGASGFQHLPANIHTLGIKSSVNPPFPGSYNVDSPYYVLYTNGTVSDYAVSYSLPVTYTASSLSTTTLATYCDTNMPVDNSDIIHATLTAIPNGFCKAITYLFVPSTDSLSQFSTLSSTTQNRIPFSYVYGIQSIFVGLSASSTSNLSSVIVSLPDIGSTTPLKTLYPLSITFLSTSTIGTYLNETFRQGMLNMQRLFLWAAFAYWLYRRIIPHHVFHTAT